MRYYLDIYIFQLCITTEKVIIFSGFYTYDLGSPNIGDLVSNTPLHDYTIPLGALLLFDSIERYCFIIYVL